MLGPVHHVGYLAADLDEAAELLSRRFGLASVREFERPQFALRGVYLGAGHGDVEVFSFTDAALARERLGGARLRLDHVAHEVPDIASIARRLHAEGVRFSGPDLRGELNEAVDLGGTLHLWTVPETCWGLSLQLLQPVAAA